jgi:hypothetical protein
MIDIFILLFCRTEKDYDGNFIFFDSIRKGFPDAFINVFSNANSRSFNCAAKSNCERCGANFFELDREIEHWQFIKDLIETQQNPFYIIDPDTVWLDKMPAKFNADLAGRYIPSFYEKNGDVNTFSRLHTSCLYLDPVAIKQKTTVAYFGHEIQHIAPSLYYQDGKRYRHDTCSSLYHFLKSEGKVIEFDNHLNDKFAHLFCGTHLSFVGDAYPELIATYQDLKDNKLNFKRLRQKQESFFAESVWI